MIRSDVLMMLVLVLGMTVPGLAQGTGGGMSPGSLGRRGFPDGTGTVSVPWFRITTDFLALEDPGFWKGLACPPGTRAAYVGQYGTIEWCEEDSEGGTDSLSGQGIDFIVRDWQVVTPGPGRVHVRRWLFEETATGPECVFRAGRSYVFCLDREPVETWRNLAEEPSCDLDSELGHLVGIIELFPTFTLPPAATGPWGIRADRVTVLRSERSTGSPSGYVQEFAVHSGEGGRCRVEREPGRNLPADPAILAKALYAVYTCRWEALGEPPRFSVSPPVTRLFLAGRGSDGKDRLASFSYDLGAWYVADPHGKWYRSTFPHLLFEVKEDVAACFAAPDKPAAQPVPWSIDAPAQPLSAT